MKDTTMGGELRRVAEKLQRKPDTKSGKMQPIIRYVSGSAPTRRPKLPTSKPD